MPPFGAQTVYQRARKTGLLMGPKHHMLNHLDKEEKLRKPTPKGAALTSLMGGKPKRPRLAANGEEEEEEAPGGPAEEPVYGPEEKPEEEGLAEEALASVAGEEEEPVHHGTEENPVDPVDGQIVIRTPQGGRVRVMFDEGPGRFTI